MSDPIGPSDRRCVDCGTQAEPPFLIICARCRNARLAVWEAKYQAIEHKKRERCKSHQSITAG